MHSKSYLVAAVAVTAAMSIPAQSDAQAQAQGRAAADTVYDPIRDMVGRLELEKYKGTIKGLTQFGDRRQGTERNRKAVDWIEAQLKSYGCTNTERITYQWAPRPRPQPPAGGRGGAGGGRGGDAASGGGRLRGIRARTGVNSDSLKQPDAKLRALDTEQTAPGERQEVYCTKVGTTHPEEMYIVGGHMDGIGWGEAANDDGSGTAVVMELARVFSSKDVKTDRSIRFVLWNNEESGLDGARAYVDQRQALQGKEAPAGSGKYPEPKWLGMVQHDMMMFDHGMPRADGTLSPEQRPEADVNIEFAGASKGAESWTRFAGKGAYGLSNECTKYDFYTNPTQGDQDEMILPPIDMSASPGSPVMSMDIAYAQRYTSDDKVEVFASDNCGANWTSVFSQSGFVMATWGPINNTAYVPDQFDPSHWKTESFPLPNFNKATLLVKIVATNDKGNNVYIDNVNLVQAGADVGISSLNKNKATLTVYPNPSNSVANIRIGSTTSGNAKVSVVNTIGQLVYEKTTTVHEGSTTLRVDIRDFATGMYTVIVETDKGSSVAKLSVSK